MPLGGVETRVCDGCTRRSGAHGCSCDTALPRRPARPARSRRRVQSWRSTRPTLRPSSSRPGRGRATSSRNTSSARSTRSGRSFGCSECAGRCGWCRASSRRSWMRPAREPSPRASGAGWSSSSRRAASPRTRPPGSTRAAAATLDALAARGEAFTSELTRDDPLLAHEAPPRDRNPLGDRGKHRLAHPSAARGRGRRRARTAARVVEHGQYRWALAAATAARDTRHRVAQAELLRRWLHAFGPATEADIRWWTGWTAREARAALAATSHHVVELDGSTGYVLADDLEPVEPSAPAGRAPPHARPDDDGLEGARVVPRPARASRCSTRNGNAGPTVWWDGRVVGGWAQRRDGEIVVEAARGRRRRGRRTRSSRGRAAAGLARRRTGRARLPPAVPARARALTDTPREQKREVRPRSGRLQGSAPAEAGDRAAGFRGSGIPLANKVSRRKISFAITSRWICEVPS